MAIAPLNLHAEPPRDLVPICSLRTFRDFWEPGAKELSLELVLQFGVLAINAANKNTDRISGLIEELGRLRVWFVQNTPSDEQKFLLASIDRLVAELETISRERIIDFTIG